MTRRERRYLFIIHVLLQKVQYVVRDTNDTITLLEQQTNLKLSELLQKQVEADKAILTVWEENTDILWQEKQELENKIVKINQKREVARRGHKEQKRYERE